MTTQASLRRGTWTVPSLLILLSLVPAAAGTSRLIQLVGGTAITPDNARFFAMPLPVVLHIVAVIPYSLLGALQFVPALRRGGRHRAARQMLAVCGLVAAVTGLWMAHVYPWPDGDGVALYLMRLIFGTWMAASLLLGVAAVQRRDFASHAAWMMRAYAIGMGAGTQALTHLPWFVLVGRPGELPRAVLMGAGWVINLSVAEWVIRRARPPGGRPRGPALKTAGMPVDPGVSAKSPRTRQACIPISSRTQGGR